MNSTNYRLRKQQLYDILESWEPYLRHPVHLIACGGTALTIQDIKESTKDVDFLVPVRAYRSLTQTLSKLGYSKVTGFGWRRNDPFIFDLFVGKKVYLTELLTSPTYAGNHIPIRDFSKIKLSALNDYDLITTKIFRSSSVDIDDCLALIRRRGKSFDFKKLRNRYKETAQYDLNPARMMANFENLMRRMES